MNHSVDIILPVYYEERNIVKVLQKIHHSVKTPKKVLIVYDTDDDPTVEIVREQKKQFPYIQIVKNNYGRGVLSALKTGLYKATSKIIVITMADLSDNPKDIDKMVGKIDEGYDLVCATRYSKGGKRIGGPMLKGVLSYALCKSLAFTTGIPTSDATNAYKCFKRSLLKDIYIESKGGFELPLEITVKAYIHKKKITEIPTTWKERKSGSSKFKLFQWFPQYMRWYIYAITNTYFR